MKNAAIVIHTIERTSQVIFWTMAAGIFILASSYMYFVNKTVWNVVARQAAESQIVALNSDLSTTEFDYINSRASVTMELAETLGFKSADNQTLFVTRESAAKNIALR